MKTIMYGLRRIERANNSRSIVDYSILLAFVSIIILFGITEFIGVSGS